MELWDGARPAASLHPRRTAGHPTRCPVGTPIRTEACGASPARGGPAPRTEPHSCFCLLPFWGPRHLPSCFSHCRAVPRWHARRNKPAPPSPSCQSRPLPASCHHPGCESVRQWCGAVTPPTHPGSPPGLTLGSLSCRLQWPLAGLPAAPPPPCACRPPRAAATVCCSDLCVGVSNCEGASGVRTRHQQHAEREKGQVSRSAGGELGCGVVSGWQPQRSR